MLILLIPKIFKEQYQHFFINTIVTHFFKVNCKLFPIDNSSIYFILTLFYIVNICLICTPSKLRYK